MRNLLKSLDGKWWLQLRACKAWLLICLVLLAGCGVGGFIASVLFCTPIGAIIGVALAIGGAIYIYDEWEGDDGSHEHPPIEPCPPPPNPPPPTRIQVCFYNGQYLEKSECPIWRISAEDPLDPNDRPVWLFDSATSSGSDTVIANQLRMSWPADSFPVVDDQVIEGSELVCMLVWFDRNADGRGDAYMTAPGPVHFVVYFANGETLDVSTALGGDPIVDGQTFEVGWTNVDGVDVYDEDFVLP